MNILDLWAPLTMRHLAAFAAVAESQSIARAAEGLGYTQPAVSHQLAALERLLDARLFDRGSGRGPARLTPAGEIFAAHVARLQTQFASAHADLQAHRDGTRAALRIGAFQSVSAQILPPLVQRLASYEPPVTLQLEEGANESDLVERLLAGRLDLAFVLMPVDEQALDVAKLLEDPYFLVGPEGGSLPSSIEGLEDLAGIPLIAPRDCRSWTAVETQLRAAGVEPRYAFRTDDNLAIKGLVQSGLGVALVSRLSLATMGEGLAVSPLSELLPPRRIGLAWARSRSLVAHRDRVVSAASDVCARLEF